MGDWAGRGEVDLLYRDDNGRSFEVCGTSEPSSELLEFCFERGANWKRSGSGAASVEDSIEEGREDDCVGREGWKNEREGCIPPVWVVPGCNCC